MIVTDKFRVFYLLLSVAPRPGPGIGKFCLLFAISVVSPFVEAATYRVGPGQAHTEIDTVPWESLNPGDAVEIEWRSTPYRSKWVIGACRHKHSTDNR